MSKQNEISITGIGIISPQVMSKDEIFNQPTYTTAKDNNFHLLDRFNPVDYLGKKGHKYMLPATRYLLSSTTVALKDANLQEGTYTPNTSGVIIGTNFNNRSYLEEKYVDVMREGLKGVEPILAPSMSINISASEVSIRYKFHAMNITLTSSIVAGMESLIMAKKQIKNNHANMIVAGATEGVPPQNVLNTYKGPIAEGGSCVFILEKAENARIRNARIYGFIKASSLRFFPHIDREKDSELYCLDKLESLLREELDIMLPKVSKPLNLYRMSGSYPLSRYVNQFIEDYMTAKKIEFNKPLCHGQRYENLGISPMLQAVHGLVDNQGYDSFIIATSPQGHISILLLDCNP